MKDNRVLIINDVTAYGKVSSLAMVPIISAYGHHPYVLPTALVSNTMDYGSSVIVDTSQFMKESIDKWKEFGFNFPVIATGLINDENQIGILVDLIKDQSPDYVMVDPIMADDGKLYPGMNPSAVNYYKELIALSDLTIPNLTEAILLSGKFSYKEDFTDEEYAALVQSLVELGAKNIVITGCKDSKSHFNLVYDHSRGSYEKIYYNIVPVALIGTGDVFSAAIISNIMNGLDLSAAVDAAGTLVRTIATDNMDNDDHFDIYIEHALQEAINEIRQR